MEKDLVSFLAYSATGLISLMFAGLGVYGLACLKKPKKLLGVDDFSPDTGQIEEVKIGIILLSLVCLTTGAFFAYAFFQLAFVQNVIFYDGTTWEVQ